MVARGEVARVTDATTTVAAWSLRVRPHRLTVVPNKPDEQDYQRRLGKALVQLRAMRGISQARLAELVERSEAAVSRWETGKATPSAWDIRVLCEVLDCPADVLVYPPELPVSPVAEELARRIEAGGRRGLSAHGPSEATGRVA